MNPKMAVACAMVSASPYTVLLQFRIALLPKIGLFMHF